MFRYIIMTATNPRVFFDLVYVTSIDPVGTPLGRIEMELYANTVPRTAENFRCLCTGEKGVTLCYKSHNFFKYSTTVLNGIVNGFMNSGDIVLDNGKGSTKLSTYGGVFADENFLVKHDTEGILTTSNYGPNTNNTQFMILLSPQQQLNGKNVAFGKVINGMDILKDLGIKYKQSAKIYTKSTGCVQIKNCGQL